MSLPLLSSHPRHHAHCCLSLSTVFIQSLGDIISSTIKSGYVLSVGSGTGLLEALLNDHFAQVESNDLHVEGVEVRSQSASLNYYLPEELTNGVDGTWALSPRLKHASGLMFVYPRIPRLVYKYLEATSSERARLEMVIWLGPKIDWIDFVDHFAVEGFSPVVILEECGLADYEMMAILRRIA